MRVFFSRVFAMHPLALIAGCCLIALTIPAYRLMDAERQQVGAVPRMIEQQGKETRTFVGQWLTENLMPPVNQMVATVDGLPVITRDLADKHLTGIRVDALSVIKESLTTADRRLGDSLARVDVALGTVDGIRKDLQPTLTNVAQITSNVNQASALAPELTRNALGAVAAFKVTMGQGAKAAIAIEGATPGFLRTMQKIGDNSDATTAKSVAMAEEGRKTLANLAANTTPLPKFIRYPAQAIGLIGSAALPVIGITKLVTAGTIPSTLVQIVGPKQ